MNYCRNLKKRKGKPFCKILNKEIPFSCCRECDKKEYKTKNPKNSFYKEYRTKNTINSFYENDIKISNNKKINNVAKMKYKSNKLAKLERNRFSIFTDNMDKCIICGKVRNDKHEIFRGANRRNSMKYGFVLPLCRECHSTKAETSEFEDFWHRQAQLYFEKNIGSREEFIRIFRRNYLD
jgi:hypothetical protein